MREYLLKLLCVRFEFLLLEICYVVLLINIKTHCTLFLPKRSAKKLPEEKKHYTQKQNLAVLKNQNKNTQKCVNNNICLYLEDYKSMATLHAHMSTNNSIISKKV